MLLSPELLKLASLAFQFRLIAIDLSLLIGLCVFLALELIADQSTRAQSERPADSSTGPGMTDGRANIAISMGAFDVPTGTHLEKHIFVPDKGDYYDIADGLPRKGRSPEELL